MKDTGHQLYKHGDKDVPDAIKDRNGDIVLDLCKVCGKGEVELNRSCVSDERLSKAADIYDRHYDGDEKDPHMVALHAVLEAQPTAHSAVWTGEINGVHVGLYGTIESIQALDTLISTLEELDIMVTKLGI